MFIDNWGNHQSLLEPVILINNWGKCLTFLELAVMIVSCFPSINFCIQEKYDYGHNILNMSVAKQLQQICLSFYFKCNVCLVLQAS